MKTVRPVFLLSVILAFLPAGTWAEYSDWSFGGGLDLVINSDANYVTTTDGTPGGLQSGPSPISGYIFGEYRQPIGDRFVFAPSASLMFFNYLYANGRALPAEIENRTAFVPTLFIDLPFLYRMEKGNFDFSFGLGPGILVRYGFLEAGVSADEISYGSDMTAGEQVSAVNSYLWSSGRWFCPTIQVGARYRLETGWGAGLSLRAGIPVSNLWSQPSVPFMDSFMLMASIVITPPAPPKEPKAADDSAPAADTATSAGEAELPVADAP